ncbi:MAG: Panacea domain-containing protein [Clostridium sp.]|uniref:Panacea domain-containing protein n=1 Tax=Clostridium sp. TaxID=1506 RepID=UPI003F38F83B
MYDAVDVANYIVTFCDFKLRKPITNLQLQKFLYYVQGFSLQIFRRPMFENKIEAWRYGPVVPDVYYWFNNNLSRGIKGIQGYKPILSEEEIGLVNEVVEALITIEPWQLVKRTHNEDPWVSNYVEGMNNEMDMESMESFFIR